MGSRRASSRKFYLFRHRSESSFSSTPLLIFHSRVRFKDIRHTHTHTYTEIHLFGQPRARSSPRFFLSSIDRPFREGRSSFLPLGNLRKNKGTIAGNLGSRLDDPALLDLEDESASLRMHREDIFFLTYRMSVVLLAELAARNAFDRSGPPILQYQS